MTRFRPYPSYKDSGVEWLGKLPDRWGRRPLKRLVVTSITDGPHETPEFTLDGIPFLSVDSIVEGRLNFAGCRFISVPDHERYCRKCRPTRNDVLIGKAASVGKIAVVDVDFEFNIWSPLAMLRPAPRLLAPRFLYYYLLSRSAQDEILLQCTHNTQNNISMDDIGELAIPLPDPPEQLAIAAFLDREAKRIDALVEKKERLVELLQEKRTALISHAVTKGLDPNVRLKDSGVEWLGAIPEQWEILRIKHLALLRSGVGITSADIREAGPYPVYGGNGIRGFTDAHSDEGEFVLIGRQGALCGCINYAHGKFWASEHAVIAYPRRAYQVLWFGELLRTMNLNQYSMSAAQPGLGVERIQELIVPVPPPAEQRAIAAFLDRETQRIDALVEKVKRSVELLKEYRTALISAAVTGKIDVRDAG